MPIKSEVDTPFQQVTCDFIMDLPESNGFNSIIRMFCATEPDQWSRYLPMAKFVHNSRTHDSIKQTLFNIILGSDPIGIPTVIPRFTAPVAEEKTKELI
jgi:hypothetical protein